MRRTFHLPSVGDEINARLVSLPLPPTAGSGCVTYGRALAAG
jgi:hypothetical protein